MAAYGHSFFGGGHVLTVRYVHKQPHRFRHRVRRQRRVQRTQARYIDLRPAACSDATTDKRESDKCQNSSTPLSNTPLRTNAPRRVATPTSLTLAPLLNPGGVSSGLDHTGHRRSNLCLQAMTILQAMKTRNSGVARKFYQKLCANLQVPSGVHCNSIRGSPGSVFRVFLRFGRRHTSGVHVSEEVGQLHERLLFHVL